MTGASLFFEWHQLNNRAGALHRDHPEGIFP
jgi:hypothetical protein